MDYLLDGIVTALQLIVTLDAEVTHCTLVSLQVSALAILLASLVGLPCSFLIGIYDFRGKKTLITLFNMLMAIPTRLRTRVGKDGMDYKVYNIAVHELGHSVEQTFSLYDVPFNALQGVPNTAFTEALAFVFQDRDLELLGLAKPDATSEALGTLDDFWGAFEISGVALVDMRVWRWMYAHPEAAPAELREATLEIARQTWNEFFAPVFGRRDVVLLGIYSHMISRGLYLPDYPLGLMIAHQIKEQVRRTGNLGTEFERMSRQGRLTPDLWMQRATGAPVGPGALLAGAEAALKRVQ